MAQNSERIIVQADPDLKELIPEFLRNRHKDIADILDAVQKCNFETVRILGHSMKGAGGGYGFDVISDIGSAIEIAAKNSDSGEIKNQTTKLAVYLDSVDVIYP